MTSTSQPIPTAETPDQSEGFGANEWLVEEMRQQYLRDPASVEGAWGDFFAGTSAPAPSGPSDPVAPVNPPATAAATTPSSTQATAAPTPQSATAPAPVGVSPAATPENPHATTSQPQLLRGPQARVVTNMEASLTVPTATSVRAIPAKLLIDTRIAINNHLKRSRGGKVSFTHLIGYAVVQALKTMPGMNAVYSEVEGKPAVTVLESINLGLAIDLAKPDGSRQLLVPAIKHAETMDFHAFWTAYDAVVAKARGSKLTPDDFAGTTVSLTNPGTLGTQSSVPRLMKDQGAIIGVGAMEYPAEYQGAAEETLARMAVSKILTLTSTYDHRIIQGAQSGEFLRRVHQLLLGGEEFYDSIYTSLRIPYQPLRWVPDATDSHEDDINKSARVQALINAYRVRGHLIADIDPLHYEQRTHPDLDIQTHGLTLWDLDREFPTGGVTGKPRAKLREILDRLQDCYCRRVGMEYMHIQDPRQRRWFQDHPELRTMTMTREDQLRILHQLNSAEAFETFLQTKYVGQKRFSLEGAEATIPLLHAVMAEAADSGLNEVCIGMPHRGRLNVLTNIAGKSYGQVFAEFEGSGDPTSVQGTGDVKYHLGTEGTYTSPSGKQTQVYLAANPSHLEAVNPVLEGVVRAKQDRLDRGGDERNAPTVPDRNQIRGTGAPVSSLESVAERSDAATNEDEPDIRGGMKERENVPFSVLPLLIHGDAAFAGQGVVSETLTLSQLRGYRTGGTIHVVINNQVGFTTAPTSSRSSHYCTDVARSVRAPIFHVNGDDPEACVRVARLAFEFRQRFHRDVIIDLVCYRRRGHNEADEPSFTQPLMYATIEKKHSVRRIYTDELIGRGDITSEEAQDALQDFQNQLERAFTETREANEQGRKGRLEQPAEQQQSIEEDRPTAVPMEVLSQIAKVQLAYPQDFTVHPKLVPQLTKRAAMVEADPHQPVVDWAMGEAFAFGSLLVEGRHVRMSGQDCRRGTFGHRHAVLIDKLTGENWTPLANLSPDQGRIWIYDSLLSEYAVLGFEYGYSVARPDALTLWEAQFGDFVDVAQPIIDEFVSAAGQKWNQRAGLVMLLPHGYEGQGPDHSSARPERFLQLYAEKNMTIAWPTTPANYFHLLRRQAYSEPRRPLIVFTPKSLLRLPASTSALQEFTDGQFQPVIADTSVDRHQVRRVVMCSGRVYYDLVAQRAANNDGATALLRLEQLAPLPLEAIAATVAQFPADAQLRWVQEEPANQGAWSYLAVNLVPQLADRPEFAGRQMQVFSRPASASPATGSHKRHDVEQEMLLDTALRE